MSITYAQGPNGCDRSYDPQKPCFIYDGSCGICARSLKWLYRLDPQAEFRAVPFQAPELSQWFPHLSPEVCSQALYLVFPNRVTLTGADAFREFLIRRPWTFCLGLLMYVPPLPFVARVLYGWIARNRHGISQSCSIETHR